MRFAAAMALVGLLLLPVHAGAAYPGQNGKIAYAKVGGIFAMNPDGSDQVQITVGEDLDPVWSPDGQRIAFVRRAGGMQSVRVVNSNGTGDSPVTSPIAGAVETPTWSSDGGRIAFTVDQEDIWVVNVDGSGLTQITGTPNEEAYLSWAPDGSRIAFTTSASIYAVKPDGSDPRALFTAGDLYWPDWSPDGQSMAFSSLYDCDGDTCMDIVTRRLDGSGGTHVVGSNGDFSATFGRPSWSPDGTRIVLTEGGRIVTRNLNGTGAVNTGVQGAVPDWQPLPDNSHDVSDNYARPRGAANFRVALVPAAKACTAPNRNHGPPLAFGSCSPPVPGSPNLTVGVGDGSPAFARSSGFMRIDVRVGAPGPPDDTDVLMRVNLTNVMRTDDLSEYTGELRAEFTVRQTDRPDYIKQTSMDFPFGFNVPCTPTPDSSLDASTCNVFTSIRALLPGAIPEAIRTMWQLDKVRVYDGGPDEDADTEAGNAPFMTQGVFVP